MKELSIEEKAKRYDEAIRESSKIINHCTGGANIPECVSVKATIEQIFPELKESEDERIRKALIDWFSDTHAADNFKGIAWERIVAWLEKQADKDEEILILKDKIESLHAAIKAIKETHRIELEKQGEQKPTDKVEPKFKVGDWITDGEAIFHITSYDIDYGYQLETAKGTLFHFSNENVENKYHLWTIQDAKEIWQGR